MSEVLIVHRSPRQGGYWHVVAGGVEPGETVTEAAERELREETGLVATVVPGLDVVEYVYPLTEEPAASRDRYDPSVAAVQVTCFRVVAPDDWEPTLDWEHDDHRWCAPEVAAAALRWPATAEALRRLLAAPRFRVLPAAEAFWRPSNQMGVANTDLAKQLGISLLGARLWRLGSGQASTKHRHEQQTELYVLLKGTGRVRVEDQLLTLDPLSALVVEPDAVRQLFNDTDTDALWLVVGCPPEPGNSLEMTPERLSSLYPDGPKALPPELA